MLERLVALVILLLLLLGAFSVSRSEDALLQLPPIAGPSCDECASDDEEDKDDDEEKEEREKEEKKKGGKKGKR